MLHIIDFDLGRNFPEQHRRRGEILNKLHELGLKVAPVHNTVPEFYMNSKYNVWTQFIWSKNIIRIKCANEADALMIQLSL